MGGGEDDDDNNGGGGVNDRDAIMVLVAELCINYPTGYNVDIHERKTISSGRNGLKPSRLLTSIQHKRSRILLGK